MTRDRMLLLVVILTQLLLSAFAIQRRHGEYLLGDNYFYETPAWNLASGHGLTMQTAVADDPWLTTSYRATHPESAQSPDAAYVPSATYAPGYTVFLAAVYVVGGHRHGAAVVANVLLLIVFLILAWRIISEMCSTETERLVAAGMLAVFPGWAFWVSAILSDMLHATLIAGFAVLFFTEKPSLRRSLLAGLVLGAALLVRPYPTLLPCALLVGWWIRRVPALAPRYLVPMAAVAWACLGTVTVRNYVAFGKVIPVTAMGLGRVLWQTTYSAGLFEDAGKDPEMQRDDRVVGAAGDWHYHEPNLAFQKAAIERIKARPVRWLGLAAWRVVRLWISAVADGAPKIVLLGFGVFQVVMLALLVAGIFVGWRDRRAMVAGSIVIVVYHWALFVPFGAEGRLLLAVRVFSIGLGALAAGAIWRRWRQSKVAT